LWGDESGPSELGGLILDQGFRGHKQKPGRLVSFMRFHLAGLYRERFAERMLAEMMGPATSDGDNAFWDAFGRKFIPVKYAEADRFCQHNRKFIEELLPREEIYLTLLPLEVINAVGTVSRETLPARRLLESIGFEYRGFVDPFDGGPHLEAATDSIPLVKNTRRARLGIAASAEKATTAAIVSHISSNGDFRATETWVEVVKGEEVRLTAEAMTLLGVEAGAMIGVTPMGKYALPKPEAKGAPAKSESGAKSTKSGERKRKRQAV
jgi:arginine N-succinyltransferase